MHKFSVITVCYNSGRTLKSTIDSVLNQSYLNIEYIIIDGASTDNTLEIIKSYESDKIKLISEPDCGIYDAMNKGISIASGEIIGILNSDDFYSNEFIVQKIVERFKTSKASCVFGDIVYVDQTDIAKIVRHWKSSPYTLSKFKSGWSPPHPSFFVLSSAYRNYGNFDNSIKLSADFDLMLRFLEVYKLDSSYIPEVCVCMRTGGASTKLSNLIIQNYGVYKSFKKYNIDVFMPVYFLKRFLPKLINKLRFAYFC